MSSTYGERFRFTVFGQSHSPAIGVTMEGIPAGFAIDMDKLQAFLDRRAPGKSPTATARKEADQPEFLSGLVGNVTCGTPITAIIRNTNTRSADYDNLRDCPGRATPTTPPISAMTAIRTWPAAATSPDG